jgi:hypothetical protein
MPGGQLTALCFNIAKRFMAVDIGLTHAKHVEIWAVHNKNIH